MAPEGDIAIAAGHGKNRIRRPSSPSLGREGLCHLASFDEPDFANVVVRGFLVLGESVKMASFQPATTSGRWGYRKNESQTGRPDRPIPDWGASRHAAKTLLIRHAGPQSRRFRW